MFSKSWWRICINLAFFKRTFKRHDEDKTYDNSQLCLLTCLCWMSLWPQKLDISWKPENFPMSRTVDLLSLCQPRYSMGNGWTDRHGSCLLVFLYCLQHFFTNGWMNSPLKQNLFLWNSRLVCWPHAEQDLCLYHYLPWNHPCPPSKSRCAHILLIAWHPG